MQTFPIGSQVWCFTRTPSTASFTLGTIRRRIEDASGMHLEVAYLDDEGDERLMSCVARDLYPAASRRTPALSAERLREAMQDIALEAQFCALGEDAASTLRSVLERAEGEVRVSTGAAPGPLRNALRHGLISDGGEGVGYELTELGLVGARLVLP